MIQRTLGRVLARVATQAPVITVTGPRQSGKTTLVKATFPEHDYVSLEDPDARSFAREDPRGFLAHLSGKAILDEVQRVPDLFSYLQTRVDESDVPGEFVLSGSQNFLLLESVSQSLAGRTASLHLFPFSLSELESRTPFPAARLGRSLLAASRTSRFELAELLFTGFYPRIHDKGLEPARWLRDYYHTYVERDVRHIVNVGDLESFSRFVRLCAGRNAQLLNLSSLANDCGIGHSTAVRWLSVLEAGFLIVLLRPHHRNFGKRLIRSPKLYFLDTGLLCSLLGIRSAEDLAVHASRGAIFESFVLSEVLKSYYHAGLPPRVHFWRDSTGHEVDLLIDEPEGLVPVEIKSGQTFTRDYLKGIRYWQRLASTESDGTGMPGAVVYGGARSFQRDDVRVYSWACL